MLERVIQLHFDSVLADLFFDEGVAFVELVEVVSGQLYHNLTVK